MSKLDYSFVGRHAEDLADGRIVAPGQRVGLTEKEAKEPHNVRLIEEGKLLKRPVKAKAKDGDSA